MIDVNDWINKNPKKAIAGAMLAVFVGFKFTNWVSDPLRDRPLTEYRVVYEHSDKYGTTCGASQGTGYYWWAEELVEGIFWDHWKSMSWCGDTEESAIKSAKSVIEKRLITERSKSKTYMAYLSKQDVVIFKDKPND